MTNADSLHVTLPMYQTSQQILRVTNGGALGLSYFADLLSPDPPPGAFARTTSSAEARGSRPADPRSVGIETAPSPKARLDAVGGPDAHGTVYRDSDFGGDLAFSWVDVSATGTALPPGESGATVGPLPIGFPFPFYGQTFTQFYFCANGYLSFTNGLATSATNTSLPSTDVGVPENLLAVFWDNLAGLGAQQHAYRQSDGSRLVVQYDGVTRTGDLGRPNSFEVILRPDGSILYQYLSLSALNLSSATVGIQNANRDDGLEVAFDEPYLHDNLAVLFEPGVTSFVKVSPNTGDVGPGNHVDLMLDFDARGLAMGDYTARLRILGSNPLTQARIIPLRLTVAAPTAVLDGPLPTRFGLRSLGPNPTPGTGSLELALPIRGRVDVNVYDVRGARVSTLAAREFEAGRHAIGWDGRDAAGRRVAAGIYFVRATSARDRSTVRLVLLGD
jgi:hypothetical protein